ncbi:hypothetical protein [Bacillus sp. 3255]|uniref:hypothetical protein n=1 Tax=Bacillus sp. 3255 TaxID=2817904 RepID=UPI00285B1BDE|nr:hypothetical protein [Bacillus sp. 3255]MDR6880385.1 hypothetical protein [Bacillus sp. 3255]
MSGIIEILLKVAPLITVILVLIRFNITTTNKSVIDILLTPKNNRDWDDFLEIISVSLILVFALNILNLIIDYSVISIVVQNWLIILDFTFLLVTSLFILGCWVFSLFGKRIQLKIINFVLFANLASLMLLSLLNTTLSQKYLVNLFVTKQYSNLLIILGALFVFYVFLFYIYRFLYRLFNGPRIPAYKIEKIPVILIEEELKDLFFIYMFDSERHILSKFPVDRKSVTFPVYVYYPKENSLVKYNKD